MKNHLTRNLTAAICVLALLLCLHPAAAAAAAGTAGDVDSGSLDMPKLSQEEIAGLLADAPHLSASDIRFDVQPSCAAPYMPGAVSTDALQAAADRLNALRRIAGLPAVALDQSLSENAQYGAVILAAIGGLSHTPEKPADMDNSFYQEACQAASSSNIAAGLPLTKAVDAFMDDSDASNIDCLGHRRWQLNPTMGKVGFGYAATSTRYRQYVDEKCWDTSGAGCGYHFISWPASGWFPVELFSGGTAWSVTLNPEEYAAPSLSSVTVTLSGGGRTWTFHRGEDGSDSGKYFNISNEGYGVSNCIIFRPDGVGTYDGLYTVCIDGLRDKRGRAASLTFQVDFFSAEAVTNWNPFTDVPGDAYYTDAVRWALRKDVTTGVSDTAFDPTGGCTRSQVVTFLWRAMGEPEPAGRTNPFQDVKAGDYFCKAVLWACENGITAGTGNGVFDPLAVCSNGQVLTFLWRAMGEPGVPGGGGSSFYAGAVAWADAAGLLRDTGAADDPGAAASRADIVTFLYRALAE